MNKRLEIFDFDRAIFNAPVPNPLNWDRSTLSRIVAPKSQSGFGRYQYPELLSYDISINDDVKTYTTKLS